MRQPLLAVNMSLLIAKLFTRFLTTITWPRFLLVWLATPITGCISLAKVGSPLAALIQKMRSFRITPTIKLPMVLALPVAARLL